MKLNFSTLFFLLACLFLSACQSNSVNVENTKEFTEDEKFNEYKLAEQYYVSGQYKKAYDIAKKLAKEGNREGQYLLGYLYFNGQGTPIDKVTGNKWIRLSADAGYRPAIEALVMLEYGLTADSKCKTNITSGNNTAASQKKENTSSSELKKVSHDKAVVLDNGESLITGSANKKVTPVINTSDINTSFINNSSLLVKKFYTVQLITSYSKNDIINYSNELLRSYPIYKDRLIIYKTTKDSQHSMYAGGFGKFNTLGQANLAREEILPILHDDTIWIRALYPLQLIQNQK
jgi:hypothetical protein